MPILFNIDDVIPGMALGKAIVSGSQILLNSRYKLTEKDIKSLKIRGISQVYISDPLLDDLCQDESREQEVATIVQNKIVGTINCVNKNIKKHSNLSVKDVYNLQKSIAECVDYIAKNPVAVAILNQSNATSFAQQHSTNVMYLSLLIALKLKSYVIQERLKIIAKGVYNVFDLNPMGLGAILCDLDIPKFEIYANRVLTKEEVQELLEHPINTYNKLPEEIHPYARTIVKTHHECYNGLGYPEGRKGEEIPILSRIIRVADAFDIATSKNLFNDARSYVWVLYHMLSGKYSTYFDQKVVGALASVIQPFPIGAKLKMNNGKYGVVVSHNTDNPFRPIVVIAFDENEIPLQKSEFEKVDLAQNKAFKIKLFMQEDLSYIYDSLPHAQKVDKNTSSKLYDILFP